MGELKLYRLLHKPTGLFYTPKKGNHSHLSLKGKVFTFKVKTNHAGTELEIPGSYFKNSSIRKRIIEKLGQSAIIESNSTIYARIRTQESDWEVIQEN